MSDVSPKNSENSDKPLKDSKQHWQQPKHVSELAKQANAVATMILNNEIDLEIATKYTAAARTVSQLKALEVYKARFTKVFPDLNL